jgi:hypothetical protein
VLILDGRKIMKITTTGTKDDVVAGIVGACFVGPRRARTQVASLTTQPLARLHWRRAMALSKRLAHNAACLN